MSEHNQTFLEDVEEHYIRLQKLCKIIWKKCECSSSMQKYDISDKK